MAHMEQYHHILLLTFPEQGHINPSLQFAKRLVRMGVKVTFATAFSALNRMTKTTPTPEGLTFVGFSDGYDGELTALDDFEHFIYEMRRRGSEAVRELITASADKGRPFTRMVYTNHLPWAGEVAHSLHFPSTFLWIQPATVLDIYYYYFNGFADDIRNNSNDPSWSIELPGLPPLTRRDIPSFLLPSNPYNFVRAWFKQHLEILDAETNPKVLINSFDELEAEALQAIEKLNLVAVGPLIPSAFLDGEDPSDTSYGADLFQKSKDYVGWLDSKLDTSVVYVSFGSVCMLSKQQMEEIAWGLLESHRPFLWVIRATKLEEKEEDKLSCRDKLEEQGMIVPWCSQVEVLSHPSLGCFVTHCGWNSTLESLASGVPVVAYPLSADQGTKAKLIKDAWKTGVRVAENEGGLVKRDEIKRRIEMVMGGGEREDEMRRNAKKWKDLAREAAKEGGSSDLNLKAFLDEI